MKICTLEWKNRLLLYGVHGQGHVEGQKDKKVPIPEVKLLRIEKQGSSCSHPAPRLVKAPESSSTVRVVVPLCNHS